MLKAMIENEFKKILSGDANIPEVNDKPRKKIVALQRAWVMVGDYTQSGDYGHLENASVIRRWGTDKGLGQLAKSGPLADTVLDPCPPVDFHILTSVFIMDCAEVWNDKSRA